MDPELFAIFCEEFTAETNRLRKLVRSQTAERVMRDLDRLV